ncbi:hypothetical protein DFH28DRAFT_982144 [Melampsora americana]|nr:hypothetical protein DFH28DRAFT_982144 [Melampsora americana]
MNSNHHHHPNQFELFNQPTLTQQTVQSKSVLHPTSLGSSSPTKMFNKPNEPITITSTHPANVNHHNANGNELKQQQQHHLLNHDSSNDLSIKKERGPPSLRKKQSQRFTVAHNQPTLEPSVPALPPSYLSHHNPTNSPNNNQTQPPQSLRHRTPSISSVSDSDYTPTSDLVHPPYMSASSNSSGGQFATVPFGASAPVSRSNTNHSGNIPSSLGTPLTGNSSLAVPGSAESDDEVIPTAIVIKNIPFSVRREQLLAILDDLMIPAPYAFNYHFDNGVFRGLAFANFRSASEADAAVAGLNGFDITGRKLRVEYKKVLQAGEKERIEKEKAIKRMRSMQLQKETVFDSYHHQSPVPSSYAYHQQDLDEVRNQMLPTRPFVPDFLQQPPPSQSQSLQTSPVKELDMNDPQTLELYSRIVIFKEDNFRDEFAFAKSLTSIQRRIVHQIAKKLELEHRSEGVGDERFVVVSKPSKNALSSLRVKKSMPDMRSGEPKMVHSLGGRKSTVNLRTAHHNHTTTPELEQSFNSLMLSHQQNHHIIRQPKGPESGTFKGFTKFRNHPGIVIDDHDGANQMNN